MLGNVLTGQGVKAKIPRQGVIRPGEGTFRVIQWFSILLYPLNSFEI